MTPACDQCRFFQRRYLNPEDEAPKPSMDGECRRHPPRLGKPLSEDTRRTDYRLGVFPRVMIFDWCGEFEASPANPDGQFHADAACFRATEPSGFGGPNTSLKDNP